jgi:thiol-disulfide isomerase/thioredoxin
MKHLLTALALSLTVGAAAARAQQPTQPTPTPQPPAPEGQQATTPAPAATPAPTPNPNAGGHEYAPLQERELSYKNWKYKTLDGGARVNLREWAAGKKLVLVVYFAPWCGNWRFERPVVTRLYEKYKAHGFDVVAVSDYGTPDDLKNHFDARPAPFTVVVESDTREARDKTPHYEYRQQTGDTRRWGSPYNIFLAPAALRRDGDVLAERVWVVNGELIEAEVEQFIRERLGLPKEAASN